MTQIVLAQSCALMAGLSSITFLDVWRRGKRKDRLALAVLAAGAMICTLNAAAI